MSQERIEAAAEALWAKSHDVPYSAAAAGWTLHYRKDAETAVAAADGVMFSDEAIERAAEELWDGADPDVQWDHISEYLKERTRVRARAVVAALKGEQ